MNLDPELASGITVGSTVKAGDVIGKVGNTARLESADESHLHFELTMNGEIIDPTPELP
jgi:murein DD-endopeptidase MepM/ murein hydrolase activator NlpD